MLTLSQGGIATFVSCQRKFQLSYLSTRIWPEPPLPLDVRERLQLGTTFHHLVALKYSNMLKQNDELLELDAPLDSWWRNFNAQGPAIGEADLLSTEKTLFYPITENLRLIGRIDLLRITPAGLFLYDWKTGAPRSREDLRLDWQTRLYLFLVYELRASFGRADLKPEELSITYWYARDPSKTVLIRYDAAWHAKNREEILQIVSTITSLIESQPNIAIWPLTSNEALCARCSFAHRCGRAYTRALLTDQQDDHQADTSSFYNNAEEDAQRLGLLDDRSVGTELDVT